MIDRQALWQMQVFVEILDAGSIAGGARALGMGASAASKVLGQLEERLGARLLQRTTRRMRLTREGELYAPRARSLIAQLEALEDQVGGATERLSGVVSMTAPPVLGRKVLIPVLTDFLEQHPEVVVELDLSGEHVDLVAQSVDLAVRVAARIGSGDLVMRRVAETPFALVASPDYIAAHGRPERLEDLGRHAVLALKHEGPGDTWTFVRDDETVDVRVDGPLRCTSADALAHAARRSLGIARLPRYLVQGDLDSGALVRVLPRVPLELPSVFILYAHAGLMPRRVRVLMDVLVERVGAILA